MKRPALQVDFLLWLNRYIGTWDYNGKRSSIRRRKDGWLEARGPNYEVALLSELLAKGKRIEPAQSPLGMYPVLLNQPLMKLWLRPDEMERLRNAWRVSRGMKHIVEAIERNIRESDDVTRRAKFEKMWLLGRSYKEPWSRDDAEVYRTLLAEFEADTSKHGRIRRTGRPVGKMAGVRKGRK
jgi:hypothetical protein